MTVNHSLYVRRNNSAAGWYANIGVPNLPLRVWDGTKWRAFTTESTGAPLKVRDDNNQWITIAYEGLYYGTVTGTFWAEYSSRTHFGGGLEIWLCDENSNITQPPYNVFATETDANGRYTFKYMARIGVRYFLYGWTHRGYHNLGTGTNSPWFTLTDDHPNITMDIKWG